MTRIGVALSGGGHRASVWGTGLLLYLAVFCGTPMSWPPAICTCSCLTSTCPHCQRRRSSVTLLGA
jgi:hypothetical protein